LFSGSYADLTNKPTIPTLVSQLANDSGFLTSVGNISNIQSEGNINIEVNLTDSTKRIWQYGEDGALTLPGGSNINTYDNGSVDLVAGSDVDAAASAGLLSNNTLNLMKVDNAGAYIATTDQAKYLTYEWNFGTDGTTQFPNSRLFNTNDFQIQSPNVTLLSTGLVTVRTSQGIPSAIGAIYSYSGDWSLNPRTNLPTYVYYGLGSGLTVTISESGGVPTGVTIVNPGSGYENGQSVNVTSGSATIAFPIIVPATKDWSFGFDGLLTFPDGTKQSTAPAITIAADDSTQRTIYLGEETVKFVGAGGITTASDGEGNITITGSSITVNGTSISLGSSATILAANPNALTIGTGLSGGNYTGNSAVTIGLASGYGDTQNPYASKTANYFLAAPNGSNGAPTFRAIVAADIPTLNQNTTGSAATLTTARNINGVGFNGSAAINIPTLTDGTNSIKITAVPASINGAPGDVVGSVAFDSTYIYYCFQEFTGTSYSLPVISGLGEFSERVNAGSSELRTAIVAAFAATPAGWSYGGYPVNNITAASGSSINIFRDYGSPIFNGVSYTLIQPSATANWKITPWGATTSAAAAGSLTGNTLASGVTASSLTSFGATPAMTSPAITTSLTTPSSSFNLINTTATTVNFAGAAITLSVGAATGTTTINNNLSMASGKTIGTTATVTSNHTTAFSAGDSAISNVALSVPRDAAIRDRTNGASVIYFDVSNGGTTNGEFQFRSSSAFTNVLTMNTTAFNVNTNAVVTARTPSLARTAFNAAMSTELTVDDMRFRITNSGLAGIFPQVIGNGSARNLAWTVVAARSGSAVTQAGSTGTIVADNAWTTLYSLGGMDSSGDTFTATLQDKGAGRIYRVTFMRSDSGGDGFNIIAERLL